MKTLAVVKNTETICGRMIPFIAVSAFPASSPNYLARPDKHSGRWDPPGPRLNAVAETFCWPHFRARAQVHIAARIGPCAGASRDRPPAFNEFPE